MGTFVNRGTYRVVQSSGTYVTNSETFSTVFTAPNTAGLLFVLFTLECYRSANASRELWLRHNSRNGSQFRQFVFPSPPTLNQDFCASFHSSLVDSADSATYYSRVCDIKGNSIISSNLIYGLNFIGNSLIMYPNESITGSISNTTATFTLYYRIQQFFAAS